MPVEARVSGVHPHRAVEGGRITIIGDALPIGSRLPRVRIGGRPTRVVYASSSSIDALVPLGFTESGSISVEVEGTDDSVSIELMAPFATGLHQVDSPVFDHEGNLFVTYSGTRGQQVPVSIFRVTAGGTRETFSSAVVNPTSLAVSPDGGLYVSSRFAGTVYRVDADGSAEPYATDLGIACGLAFAPDGRLFVGDRSGTVFSVDRSGHASVFASLPPSIAAFHLALRSDGTLFVTGPTLSSYDTVYEISADGRVTPRPERFGRPQGMALDRNGDLFLADALAGASGVYGLRAGAGPELVVAAPALVGAAFDPRGGLVVCSNETAYRTRPPG
jgi:streptogramin lyase